MWVGMYDIWRKFNIYISFLQSYQNNFIVINKYIEETIYWKIDEFSLILFAMDQISDMLKIGLNTLKNNVILAKIKCTLNFKLSKLQNPE